ncbi:MAG: T9SS type A sorting domain-containing protein [Bacteroidota bacterium]|nr:T9SS type A sorting domain-containing protein [Bacteroidota bacterium]
MRCLKIQTTLLCLLTATANAQLLKQDFSSSSSLSSYVNNSSPSNGQFNAIGSSGSSVTVSVQSNKLRFVSTGGINKGSFSRTTDFSPVPSAIIYKLDLAVSGSATAATSVAVFQVGSGFATANTTESNANVYARFSINTTTTEGAFQIKDISNKNTNTNTSVTLSGTQTITWAMNNSGALLYYFAPDGSIESVANDKADIWAGSAKLFNDVAVETPSQNITDIKFVISSGTETIDISNILIDPINNFYSASTGALDQLTTWTTNSDGSSGTTPSSFNSNFSLYAIQNRSAATISTNWTVNGTGSALVIGDGLSSTEFNIPSGSSFGVGSGTSLLIRPLSVLTVANGGTVDLNNQNVIIQSNANGNAAIGTIAGTLNNATKVTVQRYIPARRAFRLLASPVTTATYISNNWQQNTHITGNLGTSGTIDAATGFDNTATGAASMFTFDASGTNQSWTALTNTNATNLLCGKGYRIMIRGDRSINLNNNSSTANAVTLSATGTLINGTQVFNTSGTGTNVNASTLLSNVIGNYSLIGNPYACAIDWHAISTASSNIEDYYYIWDPNVSNTGSKGGYTYYSVTLGTAGNTGAVGSVSRYIQSGQSFFVRTKALSPIVQFDESAKSSTASNNSISVFDKEESKGIVTVGLFLYENKATEAAADKALVIYSNNFSHASYGIDKLYNPADNLFIKSKHDQILAAEGRSLLFSSDTILLHTSLLNPDRYVLKVKMQGFAGKDVDGYVMDRLTAQQTPLKKDEEVILDVEGTDQVVAERFVIVLNAKAFVSVKEEQQLNNISILNSYKGWTIKYAAPEAMQSDIRLCNTSGQSVKVFSLGKTNAINAFVSSADLPKGIYFLEVKVGKQKAVRKVICQ